MKKLFYVVLLLLGMGIMAGSCSKVKTDIYSATIVGSWQAYKVVDYDGKTATQGADDESIYFTFTESGIFFIEEIESDGNMAGTKQATIGLKAIPCSSVRRAQRKAGKLIS